MSNTHEQPSEPARRKHVRLDDTCGGVDLTPSLPVMAYQGPKAGGLWLNQAWVELSGRDVQWWTERFETMRGFHPESRRDVRELLESAREADPSPRTVPVRIVSSGAPWAWVRLGVFPVMPRSQQPHSVLVAFDHKHDGDLSSSDPSAHQVFGRIADSISERIVIFDVNSGEVKYKNLRRPEGLDTSWSLRAATETLDGNEDGDARILQVRQIPLEIDSTPSRLVIEIAQDMTGVAELGVNLAIAEAGVAAAVPQLSLVSDWDGQRVQKTLSFLESLLQEIALTEDPSSIQGSLELAILSVHHIQSQLSKGDFHARIEPLSLESLEGVLESVESNIRPLALMKGLVIVKSFMNEVTEARVPLEVLQQVLLSMSRNAVEMSTPGDVLRIELEVFAGHLLARVVVAEVDVLERLVLLEPQLEGSEHFLDDDAHLRLARSLLEVIGGTLAFSVLYDSDGWVLEAVVPYE